MSIDDLSNYCDELKCAWGTRYTIKWSICLVCAMYNTPIDVQSCIQWIDFDEDDDGGGGGILYALYIVHCTYSMIIMKYYEAPHKAITATVGNANQGWNVTDKGSSPTHVNDLENWIILFYIFFF